MLVWFRSTPRGKIKFFVNTAPDLNPIDHLWNVVERELRALDVHPTNLHELQDAIQSIWANISKECFQHLVESMPRRITAVLKAKGGQTHY